MKKSRTCILLSLLIALLLPGMALANAQAPDTTVCKLMHHTKGHHEEKRSSKHHYEDDHDSDHHDEEKRSSVHHDEDDHDSVHHDEDDHDTVHHDEDDHDSVHHDEDDHDVYHDDDSDVAHHDDDNHDTDHRYDNSLGGEHHYESDHGLIAYGLWQLDDDIHHDEEHGMAACELQPGDARLLTPSTSGAAGGTALTDASGDAAPADATGVGYSLLLTDNPVPDIAERCRPSVVGVINIVSTFDFTTRKTTDEEYAYGSGVVIDDAGHIVTNAHVIEGADSVRIQLSDDSELEAEVVGYDTDSDLAVLYVEGLDLPAIALGDSSQLRVGDLLIAIGNPGGYYGTVSIGVVSALERDIEEFARPMALIQTDAAMSPGISGGALLNSRGELVGIPSLGVILYEGLNFAIPVNTMKEVADEIIEYGKVRKPGIGIYYSVQDGPDEPLKNYSPAGLLVAEVGADTPAERAGMRVGDVIYAVEGTRIKSGRELMVAMQDYAAGDEVTFTVYRFSYEDRDLDENFLDITLTLEYID